MKALQICYKLNNKINTQKIHKGQVHSVFNNALNIITEDHELITLLRHDYLMAPMSILIKEQRYFKNLGITEGMKVILKKDNISILPEPIIIDLTHVKIFDSRPNYSFTKTDENQLLKSLSIMEHAIYNHGTFEGIAPLIFELGEYYNELAPFEERNIPENLYSSFIKERFAHFIGLVLKKDIPNISIATKKIIGFGPGLTPSTDDFIAGLMISLSYMTQYFKLDKGEIQRLNSSMIKEIKNKTTKVSEEILKFSSRGETTQAVRECMLSILSDSSGEKLNKKIESVLGFGDTSGTDILCGLYVGARMMVNENFRRLK